MKKLLFCASLLAFYACAFAGTDSLPKIADAPTLVPATSAQYNAVIDALQGHQVMRDSDGAVEDNVNDIGRPTSGRPRDIHLGRNLYIAGQQIDFSAISLNRTGITSGAAKTSGFPLILRPGGTGHDYCTVSATATDLVGTIDGTGFTMEADLNSDDLGLSAATQSVCYVTCTAFGNQFADEEITKTIGEFGQYIPVTITGYNILAMDGEVQTFKLYNGTDTEVFIAQVNTQTASCPAFLMPVLRGIGGTKRIAFSTGDTITALQQHFVFLDDDLETIDTTTKYPSYGKTEPSPAETGDYWWDSANKTWKRRGASSWETLGRIYLGIAICDSVDCLWAEPVDFNLAWNAMISDYSLCCGGNAQIYSTNCNVFKINVCGETVETNAFVTETIDFVHNIEAGYSAISSRWYYLYISKLGNIYISPVVPRKKDHRLGWYHPGEYWRCFGTFYLGAGGANAYQFSNPGSGNNSIELVETTTSVSGATVEQYLYASPISEKITLSVHDGTYSTPEILYVRDGKYGNGCYTTHEISVLDTDLPQQVTLHQVGNATIWVESASLHDLKMKVTAFEVNW
jgi:hypothetical protein